MSGELFYKTLITDHNDDEVKQNGWNRPEQVLPIFDIFLENVAEMSLSDNNITIIDVGCGTGMLYDCLMAREWIEVKYVGIDREIEYLDILDKKRNEYNSPDSQLDTFCYDIIENLDDVCNLIRQIGNKSKTVVCIASIFNYFFTKDQVYTIISRLCEVSDQVNVSLLVSDFCDKFDEKLTYFSIEDINNNMPDCDLIQDENIYHGVLSFYK